jgi:hypothetical protein
MNASHVTHVAALIIINDENLLMRCHGRDDESRRMCFQTPMARRNNDNERDQVRKMVSEFTGVQYRGGAAMRKVVQFNNGSEKLRVRVFVVHLSVDDNFMAPGIATLVPVEKLAAFAMKIDKDYDMTCEGMVGVLQELGYADKEGVCHAGFHVMFSSGGRAAKRLGYAPGIDPFVLTAMFDFSLLFMEY